MEIFIPYQRQSPQFVVPAPISYQTHQTQAQIHSPLRAQLCPTSALSTDEHPTQIQDQALHEFFYHVKCPLVKLIDPKFVQRYVRQGLFICIFGVNS